MFCGIPIIASKMPLCRIIEDENCGILVDYNNMSEIYNACRKLISDDILWQKYSYNARRAIMNKYNWEKEKVKLDCCFSRI